MKIEKINDNQIRCTLDRSDLLSREIKISELAYGTEKAKTLSLKRKTAGFSCRFAFLYHLFGFENLVEAICR